MSYSDLYRSAMNKVTTSENWKAETLQKMQNAQPQRRKSSLTVWKKAVVPLAAAAAFAVFLAPHALRSSVQSGGGVVNQAVTVQPFAAEANPRMISQSADGAVSGFGAGCVISAGSAEAALPPGTVFLQSATIDDSTMNDALSQLDEQLEQDEKSGLLQQPLTQSDVLASGVLNTADHPQIVFVLPASDTADSASDSGALDYLVYAVDVSD